MNFSFGIYELQIRSSSSLRRRRCVVVAVVVVMVVIIIVMVVIIIVIKTCFLNFFHVFQELKKKKKIALVGNEILD